MQTTRHSTQRSTSGQEAGPRALPHTVGVCTIVWTEAGGGLTHGPARQPSPLLPEVRQHRLRLPWKEEGFPWLTVRAWVYLVATFDDPRQPNARVQLYKDGKPSPHNGSPGTLYKSYGIRPQHGGAPVRLGTRDLRSFLTGGLDEVAICPRVLTAEEVRQHWRVARGGPS